MKKALIGILITLLLNGINPFLAQATFPGENIIFGKRGQSGEGKDKDLIKVLELAKQKQYEQALALINQKIQAWLILL